MKRVHVKFSENISNWILATVGRMRNTDWVGRILFARRFPVLAGHLSIGVAAAWCSLCRLVLGRLVLARSLLVLSLNLNGCGYTVTPLVPQDVADSSITIADPYVIEVLGSNKLWSATYPGSSAGPLVAREELHIPVDTHVVFLLRSVDFAYIFAVPKFRLKEIAVPSLEFKITLPPQASGEFRLVGEQICGDPHSDRSRRVVVESKAQFSAWLQAQAKAHSVQVQH